MTQHMVQYTVKPGQATHNEELTQAALDELQRVQPAGFRYAAFKLADELSFVHIVSTDAETGHNPMRELPALRAFHAGIRERSEQAPVRTMLSQLGSYPLIGDV